MLGAGSVTIGEGQTSETDIFYPAFVLSGLSFSAESITESILQRAGPVIL